MNKFLLFIASLLLITYVAKAQCPPAGITLQTQGEIDNFKKAYPYCESIQGSLFINGAYITDLSGMSKIKTIQGDLNISLCPDLQSLSGLGELTEIGGYFTLRGTGILTPNGISNLSKIGSYLRIRSNYAMLDVTGFEALTEVGGYVEIDDNDDLIDLRGFFGLNSVGMYVSIKGNYALTEIKGFNLLNYIPGYLEITNNKGLTQIDGFTSLDSVGSYMRITVNDNLKHFEGLQNVKTVQGYLFVADNDKLENIKGLESLSFVKDSVWINYNPYLTSAAGLENMTSFNGNLYFSYNDRLKDISALKNVTKINGDFLLIKNDSLGFLTGLEKLKHVEGDFRLGSWYLADISGLKSLETIGGTLQISHKTTRMFTLHGLEKLQSIGGELAIQQNDSLKDISALINLKSIGGQLLLRDNKKLASLKGLDNIDPKSITKLHLQNSKILYDCSVKSICEYLTIGMGSILILQNDSGCNTAQEIIAACKPDTTTVSIYANNFDKISIYPNPVNNIINITGLENQQNVAVKLRDILGKEVILNKLNFNYSYDLNHLKTGVYFVEIKINNKTKTYKILRN